MGDSNSKKKINWGKVAGVALTVATAVVSALQNSKGQNQN
jgi:hypothetical protein